MQRLNQLGIFILFAVLLLGSCSDVAMFSPSVKESVGVNVLSLSEGDFIEGGQSIDFIIQTKQQSAEPELLEIDLNTVTAQGVEQSVWNTSISSPLTDEELELLLPELETGQYTIVFTVVDAEGAREEERIDFFYVNGEYAIRGISSFPPTTTAGHETVLEADLLYPDQANPYIRWSQEEVVLAKGSLADGLRKITWSAPDAQGVYSIRVEMFPVPPPLGDDYSFSSSVELTAKLFVSAESLLTEDELVPEDSYYALFHLNGSLRNSGMLGTESAEEEAQSFGQIRWNNESGIMGLQTGSGSGLRCPLNILPILEGELSPCTITFKLLPAGENANQNLMVIDQNERFRFRIFFDADGQLVATIGPQDELLYLPSGIGGLDSGQFHRIDLSLVPLEDQLQALWFLDGKQTASIVEAPLPRDLSQEGQTTISGIDGFTGTITEMGVYYRDILDRPSVDPGIYQSRMEQEYGGRLVLAEGFEGLYVPDPEENWTVDTNGAANLQGGRLILPAASRLTTRLFDLGEAGTSFFIEFFGTIPPGSTVALQWEEEETPFWVVDPRGKILTRTEGGLEEAADFAPTDTELRLTLSSGHVRLETDGTPILFDFDPPAVPWLSVSLQSPGEGDDLEIDTILIYQEQKNSP
jgi:hypothetical protein